MIDKLSTWMMTGKKIVDTKNVGITIAPAVWFFIVGVIALAIFMSTK